MSDTTERVVKEFVICFGIASGLFFAAGVNPESEAYKGLIKIIEVFAPNSNLSWWFKILPSIVTIATILSALMMGGIYGLLAIILGFFGGAFLVWIPLMGIILCGVAILIGFIAFSPEDNYY